MTPRTPLAARNIASVSSCASRECTITVSWDDSRAGGLSKEPVKTTTQL